MEEIISPSFLELSSEGAFVNLEVIPESSLFLSFVTEVFSKGYYFSGLHYQNFSNILYNFNNFKLKNKKAFLAKVIIALSVEKNHLYDRFKIREDTAFYEFGSGREKEPGSDVSGITIDEFVAAAWNKQIRFGLNIESITQKLSSRSTGMGEIAQSTSPVKGEDAKLTYLTKVERDLSPVEDTKTGRIDLKRYKCIYPQILDLQKNRIICKVNATDGDPGYSLSGRQLPAKPGRDLDLKALVGESTRIIMENEMEYLIAERVGYIIINPKNNKISVTAEAHNYSPIGPETGSLEISASHFIQHNDILKGYSIKCNNINVEEGNVNGEIISERGDIEIQGNVNNGRLIARKGIVRVKGIVTMNSYLKSLQGDIILNVVENSTLVGKNISVTTAVNCNISGETIKIASLQSSKVVGLSVHIANSAPSSHKGEISDIIIPVLELTDKRIRVISHILEEKKEKQQKIDEKATKLKHNKILLEYLQAVKASNAPVINVLLRNATPILKELNKVSRESEACKEEVENIEKELNSLKEEQDRRLKTLQEIQQCTLENAPGEKINLKLYGGLDWPLEIERVGEDDVSYNNFMALVDSLTHGMSSYKRKGYIQELTAACSFDHLSLLKMYESANIIDPMKKSDRSLDKGASGKDEHRENRVSVINEEDFKYFLKEKKWRSGRRSEEVLIDGIFKGYLHEFNSSELSILLEKAQKWKPFFEKGERLKLVANIFGNELKHDLIVAYIGEKPDYLRISGYFININNDDVNKIYKLKSRYEVLQKSSGRGS